MEAHSKAVICVVPIVEGAPRFAGCKAGVYELSTQRSELRKILYGQFKMQAQEASIEPSLPTSIVVAVAKEDGGDERGDDSVVTAVNKLCYSRDEGEPPSPEATRYGTNEMGERFKIFTEDEEGKLPPGWEIREYDHPPSKRWVRTSTWYYDHNRKLETYISPPGEDWIPTPKHDHCANNNDPYCTMFRHHLHARRPLAEPPMLDYDTFIAKELPSDIRFSKLFPNDIEKWTRCRDHDTERYVLFAYKEWAQDMAAYGSNSAKAAFYQELRKELSVEYREVDAERNAAFEGVGELALWEFEHLDQDGNTKGIQAWSTEEWDRKWLFQKAWQKFGWLAPSGYEPLKRHWYCEWKGIACQCYRCRPNRPQEQCQCSDCHKQRDEEQQSRAASAADFNFSSAVSSGLSEATRAQDDGPSPGAEVRQTEPSQDTEVNLPEQDLDQRYSGKGQELEQEADCASAVEPARPQIATNTSKGK